MLLVFRYALAALRAAARERRERAFENIALRHQLEVLTRSRRQRRPSFATRTSRGRRSEVPEGLSGSSPSTRTSWRSRATPRRGISIALRAAPRMSVRSASSSPWIRRNTRSTATSRTGTSLRGRCRSSRRTSTKWRSKSSMRSSNACSTELRVRGAATSSSTWRCASPCTPSVSCWAFREKTPSRCSTGPTRSPTERSRVPEGAHQGGDRAARDGADPGLLQGAGGRTPQQPSERPDDGAGSGDHRRQAAARDRGPGVHRICRPLPYHLATWPRRADTFQCARRRWDAPAVPGAVLDDRPQADGLSTRTPEDRVPTALVGCSRSPRPRENATFE